MKNVYLTLIFTLFMALAASTQNLLTEDFIYDPIDSLENSGNWIRSGINTEFNIKIVSPGLEYKDYVGSGKGNSCLITNSGNGDILFMNFSSPITSGAAYLAFMVRVDSLPSSFIQGYCISFNPNTGGTNLNTALHINRLSDSTFDLGVRKLSFIDFSNLVFNIHKTYLVVLKYSIVNGNSNDSSSLYVFTDGVPDAEPNQPLAATIEGDDYTGQGSVYLNNNYAQDGLKGCNIKIDGIRVGDTWANSVLSTLTSVSSKVSKEELRSDNYPNPFHYQTKISYQIPSRGFVRINIFDPSGTKCDDLINEIQESGNHELVWAPADLPAGVYTCAIQFNGIVISNKLLRIK